MAISSRGIKAVKFAIDMTPDISPYMLAKARTRRGDKRAASIDKTKKRPVVRTNTL